MKYKNTKHGTVYEVIFDNVLDVTDTGVLRSVVVYKSIRSSQVFVRERTEFFVKFEAVDEQSNI
jgi:hypothetical protein